MKIRFTPSARAQFLFALAFIRRDKPSAATRFRERAETVLRRLEDFPESGRVVPEFPDLPYREVVNGERLAKICTKLNRFLLFKSITLLTRPAPQLFVSRVEIIFSA